MTPEQERAELKELIRQRTEQAVEHRKDVAQAIEDEQNNVFDPFAAPQAPRFGFTTLQSYVDYQDRIRGGVNAINAQKATQKGRGQGPGQR